MQKLFNFVLDFLFPLSKEAAKLRTLSPLEVCALPKAPAPPFPFISSLFSYKDPVVKELVLSIKNKKDRHAVLCAAYALHKKLSESSGKITLVSIPISQKRRNARGYNQCEFLIEEILKLDAEHRLEMKLLLSRAKDRGEQKIKNREERLGSTSDIFTVNIEENQNPIIIIDDVCTTGSTLKEARDALLRGGYKDVSALTLAH